MIVGEIVIYMDNSATTKVRQEVVEAMLPCFTEQFGNPSSIYHFSGADAGKLINNSREIIAKCIGAKSNEIYFTAGGTESDNWAIRSVAKMLRGKGNRLITSKIEHHAVLHSFQALEDEGFDIVYLDVNEYGQVDLEQLRNEINEETSLVSIMMANNEVGTVQPVAEIAKIAHENGALFHTDAVQALGSFEIDVSRMGIDLASFSAHKIYGPKGVGALYVNNKVNIEPFILGGAQERKKRAGTENVPGIVGFGKALELLDGELEFHQKHLREMSNLLIQRITSEIDNVVLTGHPSERHPGIASFCFEFAEGEAIILDLNFAGISASTGSACTTGSAGASHVLQAMGISDMISHGSLRLSVGYFNTIEEVNTVVDVLKKSIKRLRKMSPLCD